MSIAECESVQSAFTPTRNYTCQSEKDEWWYVKRWSKDAKPYRTPSSREIVKEIFRTRRGMSGYPGGPLWKKALRARVGTSDDIGTFVKLTNSYALVGGSDETNAFCRTVSDDLYDVAVIKMQIAGCRVIGRMCIANKHGFVVPDNIYENELQQIKEELPDSVQIQKVEERLSALGNVVACNDKFAIIHPELDKETEEIIENTLQVEVFRHLIDNNPLVGSYCVLNNNGGLLTAAASKEDLENLSLMLDLPLTMGTVNNGNNVVASGLVANDSIAYGGMKTTGHEFSSIELAFHLK